MRVLPRLSATLLGLLLPSTLLLYRLFGGEDGTAGFENAHIPEELGMYRTTSEERFDPSSMALVQPDRYLLRLYERPDSDRLNWAYIAFYGSRTSTQAHDPEICYPAQGWEVTGRSTVEFSVDDGGIVHATLLRAQKHGRHEIALYWFQPAGRWPGPVWKEQLLRVADAMATRPRLAFVRISSPIHRGSEQPDELLELARRLAPSVRRALGRGE